MSEVKLEVKRGGGHVKTPAEGEQILLRNLKDAGCDSATIERYFQLQKEGRRQDQYRLLCLHRASLLDQVHISQHKIDCLDYLIYTMKKGQF